jgi:hypothetical protein
MGKGEVVPESRIFAGWVRKAVKADSGEERLLLIG